MKKQLKKLAVLASGNGTTLQSIIDAISKKELDSTISIVISNNSDAYALKRAEEANIKTKLIPKNVIRDFIIINTHPALLPKYGGKGMYGMNVHRAIVENHEKETGVTLHFVNEEYDKGKIIAQTKVKVFKKDTPDDVSARVQKAEKIQLVNSLKDFSEGKIDI